MFNKKCGLLLLTLLLLLVSVSGVCATDNNTDSLNPVGDNSLELTNNTVLSGFNNVDLSNNETINSVSNDSSDLSTVPCAVSSYISVMDSYNKSVDVETGIKETHTVNNTTSILGLTNALTKHGLKSNVIKNISIEDLKELHKDKRLNIIVHMYIFDDYHFAHIKEIKNDKIVFNGGFSLLLNEFKQYCTNISIIITNDVFLNLNSFGTNINKNNWSNIKGKLTEREIYNLNIGLIKRSLSLNSECNKLKANLKYDSTKQEVASFENILFGNSLKPKMDNLLTIQKQLQAVTNNPNKSKKLLKDLNNILTPMQKSLKSTIGRLTHLKKYIINHAKYDENLKASNVVVSPKVLDVPKLLGDCGEAITENPVLKQFVKNFEDSVNNLNPLNAHPELREELDQKYGLDHHKFGFIDYYTLK